MRALAGIAAVLSPLVLGLASCGEGERPVSVVLVVLDTTRADRLSVYGYHRDTTPHLKRFAEEATTFTDAWSPAGWTGPAHASLFTGLRPEHHGFVEGNRPFLDQEAVTLAELYRDAGYATACFTNNGFLSAEYGLIQGFEEVVALYGNDKPPLPTARATHERAADWAAAMQRGGRPFFLVINDMEPHIPYEPTAEDETRFLGANAGTADAARTRDIGEFNFLGYNLGLEEPNAEIRTIISDLYDAEVATLDRELGRLIDRLRADGLLDRTVVVIVGDHGENLGEHHLLGHKFSLHRTIRHVPLLIRWPPAFAAGAVIDDVVRLEDVPATLLELSGLEPQAQLDGASLTGELGGRVAHGVYGIMYRYEVDGKRMYPDRDTSPFRTAIQSIYDGRHHYIRYSDGREELYDLRGDPGEERDLSATATAALEEMRARLRAHSDGDSLLSFLME